MKFGKPQLSGIIALITTGALLSSQPAAHAATEAPDDAPGSAPDTQIVLNDGTVVGLGDTITFTFQGEKPVDDDTAHPQSCPEVNDPPTYTVKGKPHFIKDYDRPQSTWLEPGQWVDWSVSGGHEFTWEVRAGIEAEAGAIITKAKVKLDAGISNKYIWNSSMTVHDKNTTKKGYRAVLGQVGWRLTGTKTWIASPCRVMTMDDITFNAPRAGDMSIGRQTS